MNISLNEFIIIFRERSENDKVLLINKFKSDFAKDESIQLYNKIESLKSCILKWQNISFENLNKVPPLVFTGNIGTMVYNSIFDALLKENPCTFSYSRKSINSIQDKELLDLFNLKLSMLLKILESHVESIDDFETMLIKIRDIFNTDLNYN